MELGHLAHERLPDAGAARSRRADRMDVRRRRVHPPVRAPRRRYTLVLGTGPRRRARAGRHHHDAPSDAGVATTWDVLGVGFEHVCAIRESGDLYSLEGDNDSGEIVNGNTTDQNVPIYIAPGAHWKAVSAGTGTCAIRFTGELYCWGEKRGPPSPHPGRRRRGLDGRRRRPKELPVCPGQHPSNLRYSRARHVALLGGCPARRRHLEPQRGAPPDWQ